jgi:hypothetical protein
MSPKYYTYFFVLLWIGAAIVWDLFVFRKWGAEATITRTLESWTEDFPILLIALGSLLWHLFGKGK